MLKESTKYPEDLLFNITKTVTILDFSSKGFFKQFHITRAQFAALSQIAVAGDEGISLSGLSERMSVSKANITTLIDRMEAVGFVLRTSHNKDRRSTLVAATEKGKQCLKDILPARKKLASTIFACLSEEEMQQSNETLLKLQASLLAAFKKYV